MSLIEWKPEFSVGVEAVDHEHQELIGLINDLHEVMRGSGTHDEVVETLGEIYAQISAHFALEEKIMRDARYPGLSSHKEDHESLLDELLYIIDGVEDDGSYDEKKLSDGMANWFSEHFRTHDAKLHRQLG
jgi:hemerythrin-like metal-binding protein